MEEIATRYSNVVLGTVRRLGLWGPSLDGGSSSKGVRWAALSLSQLSSCVQLDLDNRPIVVVLMFETNLM